jgi:hypothetical protein
MKLFKNTKTQTIENTEVAALKEWCASLELRDYSPDLPFLQQWDKQLIFAYGEEMFGHRRHDAFGLEPINNNDQVYSAYTELPFTLWNKKLGDHSYPVALPHAFKNTYPYAPLSSIRGELYSVSRPYTDSLVCLDNLRLNGVIFRRVRVSLSVPYRRYRWTKRQGSLPPEQSHKRIRAWMYIGISEYWDEQINDYLFSPVKRIECKNPRVPDHYHFTQEEYR